MPTLPVEAVTMPAVLRGQANGRLDPGILVATPGLAGGPTVRLVAPAARAWRAMCAAAQRAGHVLKATGLTDSYRDYARQRQLFLERFTLTVLAGQPTRRWDGKTWYLRRGVALAAVPGTSNHGWGLAVDVGEERDGDSGTESIDAATVAWLIGHAHLYGFSAEVQSEPWHWRYFAGDRIPAAILAFEGKDMTPEESAQLGALYHALIPDPPARVQGAWTFTRPDGRTVPINPLYAAIDQVAERVEKVNVAPQPQPAPVDIAALVTALRPELDAAAERAVRKVLGSLDKETTQP